MAQSRTKQDPCILRRKLQSVLRSASSSDTHLRFAGGVLRQDGRYKKEDVVWSLFFLYIVTTLNNLYDAKALQAIEKNSKNGRRKHQEAQENASKKETQKPKRNPQKTYISQLYSQHLLLYTLPLGGQRLDSKAFRLDSIYCEQRNKISRAREMGMTSENQLYQSGKSRDKSHDKSRSDRKRSGM